ncbi:ras-domain-containing protein, partial [Aureobasidium melanogenum]
MARQRRLSSASATAPDNSLPPESELGSMYDYLAKIILLGPSSAGKSCLLHRFVNSSWRILSSQTIGVEFATKIVKVGDGNRRKRIKLQLWDTAGTERFRSVSRSYYRGAAGAILVYDITSRDSFAQLGTFLNDARALASPQLTLLLAGNKSDLADPVDSDAESDDETDDTGAFSPPFGQTPSSYDSRRFDSIASRGTIPRGGNGARATFAPDGRQVSALQATQWATSQTIPLAVEVSAFNGDGVDELFTRLARMILAKIELGEIDPDDPLSGIQYGDSLSWAVDDGGSSIKSGMDGPRRRRRRAGTGQWASGLREWEEVFRLDGPRRKGCC